MRQEIVPEAPPEVGWGAVVMLVALPVVILVVPWLLGYGSKTVREAPEGTVGASWFSSVRERQLWTWTGVVLLAIYATLAPAARVAAALRERGLLGPVSSAVLLCIVLAFAVPWLRQRPGLREVGVAVGVVAVYVATLVRLPVPEARSHLFEYGLVALLVYHALLERRANGRQVPLPAVSAVLIAVFVGWVDEVFQYFIPSRTYDRLDVGFNAVAAMMAVSAAVFMGWARRLDLAGRLGWRGGRP